MAVGLPQGMPYLAMIAHDAARMHHAQPLAHGYDPHARPYDAPPPAPHPPAHAVPGSWGRVPDPSQFSNLQGQPPQALPQRAGLYSRPAAVGEGGYGFLPPPPPQLPAEPPAASEASRFVPPRYLSTDGSLRDERDAAPRSTDPIIAPAGVARVASGANLAPIGASLSSRSSSVLDGAAPQVRVLQVHLAAFVSLGAAHALSGSTLAPIRSIPARGATPCCISRRHKSAGRKLACSSIVSGLCSVGVMCVLSGADTALISSNVGSRSGSIRVSCSMAEYSPLVQ